MKSNFNWMKSNFWGFLLGFILAVLILLFYVWWVVQPSGQFLWYISALGNLTNLISSIGFLGTFIAAIAALLAAREAKKTAEATSENVEATNRTAKATLRTAEETRNSLLAEILMRITEAYGSEEMLLDIKNLIYFKDSLGSDFAKRVAENPTAYESFNGSRRKYLHHFYKIYLLLDAGIVDESFVMKIVSRDSLKILLDIVEPLESAKDPSYNKPMFEAFRKIYKKLEKM